MKFMMMMKANADYEAGRPPPQALMEAMGTYTAKNVAAGIVVLTGGLAPSAMGGARVHVRDGKMQTVDGPFAETKELIGGFAVVEARSREHALEIAREFMQLHRDVLGPTWEGSCEIRPMFGGSTEIPCPEVDERPARAIEHA